MKAILLFTALIFFTALRLFSQGVDDALINSQIVYEGTSRSIAMGGATGAMGGDVTAACINPAGLGLYRGSEYTFTTGLQHNLVSSTYYGERTNEGKTRMSIPNFGAVLSLECSNYKPLRFIQIGIGLTRTNDYNDIRHYRGMNPSSSYIDSYLQTIYDVDELYDPSTHIGDYLYDNFAYTLHPAWETFLIDQNHDSLGNIYFDSPIPQGNIIQDNEVVSSGRAEEWSFAMSANILDKLFVGGSMGLDHIKRRISHTYTETPGSAGHNAFREWSFEETLNNDAWGVNLKLGMIYMPTSWFRFGASWHTRTIYAIDETWYTTTKSSLVHDPQGSYQYYSPTLNQEYDCFTIPSYTGSIAFLLGQRGMITADLDYLNYGKAKLNSSDYSFADVNADIKDILGHSFNIRVGSEWRVYQYFLRVGAAYYGSPYGFGDPDKSTKRLGLGIGYVSGSGIHWDFAYELGQSTIIDRPYSFYVNGVNVVDGAVLHQWRNKFTITMKLK